MNPYQGCEHGCIYCYARNSHEYWGYSTGMEFEQNILVKRDAPKLLESTLMHEKWKPDSIMLSGNTDCYQPAERKLGITRKLLEVFLKLQHPVGIITKNALIERDKDILSELAANRLVCVTMSLTTLNEDLKRIMEPRTSSAKTVLRTVRSLSSAGIPVNINMAPVVPALTDEEIFDVVKAVAEHGASGIGCIVVRLNGHNGALFEDWVKKNFPDRANKVLNQIKDMHGGKLNDSVFGRRMKGEGKFAELVRVQMSLARKKYLAGRSIPPMNFELFEPRRQQLWDEGKEPEKQLRLF
jgi:DNA repair photolyase